MKSKLKHIYSLTFRVRQSLKVAGVFLVIAGTVPIGIYAASLDGSPASGLDFSINLGSNQRKMIELDKTFQEKKNAINKKLTTISEKQKQAQDIADQKTDLANQVDDIKTQIAEVQAKVDAKKALEAAIAARAALHIMEQGVYDYDAAENLYDLGNCTWYVKSLRPDIGNHWGNANQWYASAAADGYLEGYQAKKGAIGVSFAGWAGHVVYVNSWNGDGTINISEMNYAGLYSTRTRIASESDFVYIYQKP